MNQRDELGLQGRRVLVTGASSGIGRATAVELSRRGAALILVGRDKHRLERTAESLEDGDHDMLTLDLRDHASIFPSVKEMASSRGRLYGMCHAAGVVDTKPLSASTVKNLQAILDVNLIAGLELARVVCRRDVMEKEGGSLLFIASIYGLIGMPGESAYSASKGALLASVRTLAVELARRRIRVNALSPGFVKTTMTDDAMSRLSSEHVKRIVEAHPLGIGRPEDVARAAVFLLAPVNSWITGSNLVIDGGYTIQ